MLRFHKANQPSTYIAYADGYAYQVCKARGEKRWQVSVWLLGRTAGVPAEGVAPSVFVKERVACTTTDTKSLGCGVCQAYEALGDGYQSHEHGGKARLTTAVLMAYDDDRTVSSPEVREGLAAMRRGDVVEA